MHPSYSSDKNRPHKGSGHYPPNPNQWAPERQGLDLRQSLGIPVTGILPVLRAFELLPHVIVMAHGDVPAAALVLKYWRTAGKARWSGLAWPLSDGRVLVLYNDAHAPTRIRATLMEEFFHLQLGHPPSTVRIIAGEDRVRTHDPTVEAEAYHCAAAALVPYQVLRSMVKSGLPVAVIARNLEVSPALIQFRLNVTRLRRSHVRRKR